MGIVYHDGQSAGGGGVVLNLTTAAKSWTVGRRLLVGATATRNGHSVGFDWAISDSSGLTWTPIFTSQLNTARATFHQQVQVWASSPVTTSSPTSITVDPQAPFNVTYNGLAISVMELSGWDGTAIQAAESSSTFDGAGDTTVTLASAISSGFAAAFYGEQADSSSSATWTDDPGWTRATASTTGLPAGEHASWYYTTGADPDESATLGVAVGGTTYSAILAVLELQAAPSSIAGAVRAGAGVVARVTGTKTATGSAARVPVGTTARTTAAKTATGAVRAGATTVARSTGAKVAAGAAQVAATVTARATPRKVATGGTMAAGGITARAPGAKVGRASVRAAVAVIVRTPSRAPVEAWSWYLRRSGAWLSASPKLDGVHSTTTDVT